MMSDIITLFCLVYGEPIANAFPVKIPQTDTFDDLKKLIKKEKTPCFDDIAADELRLWKVNIPDDDNAAERLRNFKDDPFNDTKELRATWEIQKVFPDEPTKEHIHIIIKRPARKCYFYMSSFSSIRPLASLT